MKPTVLAVKGRRSRKRKTNYEWSEAWGVLLRSFCVLPAPFLVKSQPAAAVFQYYGSSFAEQLHYLPLNMQDLSCAHSWNLTWFQTGTQNYWHKKYVRMVWSFPSVNILFHNLVWLADSDTVERGHQTDMEQKLAAIILWICILYLLIL